jgi:hypothetical protein
MTKQKQKPVPLQEWQQDVIRAVPNSLLRDIVADSRRGPTAPSSLARPVQSEPRQAGGGTAALKPPPGIDHIDRIGQAFAHNDKMAALKVKVETQWLEFHLEQAKRPLVESEYEPFDSENMKR